MACLKSHGECRNGTVGVMTEGRTAKPFLMACRVEHGADSKAWWGGMPLVNPRKRSKKIISKNLRIRTNQKKSPCSNFISLERTAFSAFFVMWIGFQPLQKKGTRSCFFSARCLPLDAISEAKVIECTPRAALWSEVAGLSFPFGKNACANHRGEPLERMPFRGECVFPD